VLDLVQELALVAVTYVLLDEVLQPLPFYFPLQE
jgi:hypothetical protein